jgi:FixJ family two-component response regulator
MPIVFITGHRDVPKTLQAMKAGAVEFLTKPFGDEPLLSAIRQALESSRVALDHEAEMRALRDCYASLTPRERQVMALVVSGLLNKQVSGELGISDDGEGAPRQGYAKDENRFSRRLGENSRQTPPPTCAGL